LIVDDGSSDDIAATALSSSRPNATETDICVVRLERNRGKPGKGGAMWHGMLRTRGSRLLMTETDDASCFVLMRSITPRGERWAAESD
jgi:hypothetical protein